MRHQPYNHARLKHIHSTYKGIQLDLIHTLRICLSLGPVFRPAQDLNSPTPHRSEMRLHILAAFRLFICQRAQNDSKLPAYHRPFRFYNPHRSTVAFASVSRSRVADDSVALPAVNTVSVHFIFAAIPSPPKPCTRSPAREALHEKLCTRSSVREVVWQEGFRLTPLTLPGSRQPDAARRNPADL